MFSKHSEFFKRDVLDSAYEIPNWSTFLSTKSKRRKPRNKIESWWQSFLAYLIPIDAVYFIALIIFFSLLVSLRLDQTLSGGGTLTRFLSLPHDSRVDSYLFYLDTQEPTLLLAGDQQDKQEQVLKPNFILADKTYTMKAGDTLSLIAVLNSVSVETLISYNDISDVKRLRAGDKIKIPNMNGILHIVKAGESIASLASEYKITRECILDANDLSNSVLSLGQRVFLPGAHMNQTKLQEALGELFIYPTKGYLTSGYGWRTDPISGIRRFHNGLDLANRLNTPIYASRAGRVIVVSVHPEFGKYIIIEHGSGYQTLYGHLNDYEVNKGQYVNRGQLIARMGNTGYSTGVHLHFSVYKNGKSVNPLTLLN